MGKNSETDALSSNLKTLNLEEEEEEGEKEEGKKRRTVKEQQILHRRRRKRMRQVLVKILCRNSFPLCLFYVRMRIRNGCTGGGVGSGGY